MVVQAFPSHRRQWLSREDAKSLVDSVLPSQSFQNSLYRSLIDEGLLVEDVIGEPGDGDGESVYLGYERLADHFSAQVLLDAYLQRQASGAGGPELTQEGDQLSPGVLESLFIQAPEKLNRELMELAPSVLKHWRWADAYRQSLVWRDPTAFTERALHWFNESILRDSDQTGALEVLLTLASVPDHPWNAEFLDRQLRPKSMPDRDEWWTINLHHLWTERQSATHRIIEWALSVKVTDKVDQDAVQLASLTLVWMFSSSNRYLRDRATKAALNLLTGREPIAAQLVRRFGDVDDVYVLERVLAVAYGVAMRSSDSERTREMADAVLQTVFSAVPIVPQLLLRDYARGVVERLHRLAPLPDKTMRLVRPPYGSKWPAIPSQSTIKRLEESFGSDGNDGRGARRIATSVLHDDFALYVIGTNSWSTDWLSLRLDQPAWRSWRDALREFEAGLSPALLPARDAVTDAERNLSALTARKLFAGLAGSRVDDGVSGSGFDPLLAAARTAVKLARTRLLDSLDLEQKKRLREIWRAQKSLSSDRPPRFDLRLIQRYVLKRVFSLGWRADRFEYFDTYVTGYRGRHAAKAERIGKKYQWIAYHEICALVADNFQFRADRGTSEFERSYEGPWQDFFRDIDPSHSMIKTGGDAKSRKGWWAPRFGLDWGNDLDGKSWTKELSDFPSPPDILSPVDAEGRKWLVANLYFSHARPTPEGMEREDIESRDLWCELRGFLVRTEDVDAFMNWAEGVDFWGQWMPQAPSFHRMFLGEYLWSPAWRHFDQAYYGSEGWVRPGKSCPVSVRSASVEYHEESSGFDCSIDSGFRLHLPDEELERLLNLSWTGQAADFHDASRRLAATDPSAFEKGPAALLLRQDLVEQMAKTEGITVCWMVIGEKFAHHPGPMKRLGAVHVSGACALRDGRLEGFLHFLEDDQHTELPEAVLSTRRFSSAAGPVGFAG